MESFAAAPGVVRRCGISAVVELFGITGANLASGAGASTAQCTSAAARGDPARNADECDQGPGRYLDEPGANQGK